MNGHSRSKRYLDEGEIGLISHGDSHSLLVVRQRPAVSASSPRLPPLPPLSSHLGVVSAGVLILIYAGLAMLANPRFALLVLAGSLVGNRLFRFAHDRTKRLSAEVTHTGHAFQRLLIQFAAHFTYLKATGLLRTYAETLEREVHRLEHANRTMGLITAIVARAGRIARRVSVRCIRSCAPFSRGVAGVMR